MCEGDTKFLYAMKLALPKDLTCMCSHIIIFYRYTSTSKHALTFLKCMIKEHVFMDLVSLN